MAQCWRVLAFEIPFICFPLTTAEAVGAAAKDLEGQKEIRGANEGGRKEAGAQEIGARYPSHDRNVQGILDIRDRLGYSKG